MTAEHISLRFLVALVAFAGLTEVAIALMPYLMSSAGWFCGPCGQMTDDVSSLESVSARSIAADFGGHCFSAS